METGHGVLRRFAVCLDQLVSLLFHRFLIKGSIHVGRFPREKGCPAVFPLLEKASLSADSHSFVQAVFIIGDVQVLIIPGFLHRILHQIQILLLHGFIFFLQKIHHLRFGKTACRNAVNSHTRYHRITFHPKKGGGSSREERHQ